ncbi:hypothetical protein PR202_ga13016 [Eleusine coracana subsp. coracana]|uniref:Piwi domain-containing protein n=1 Tax=Eleusine coracana subsp. coracana TaxID=191504 RepID=A0AAV5CDL8_ELECO|nr:hypothetical protein PR202_ga13016 [Eleusine coracana subsp. coracana]
MAVSEAQAAAPRVGPSSSAPAPAQALPAAAPVQGMMTPESRLPPASSKALVFPARPGYGTAGRRCRVRANHFLVQAADRDIYHYDVTITPESNSRERNRWVISELVKLHKQHLDGRLPVYDGRKGLFTAGPLPFQSKQFALKLTNPDRANQGEKEYNVTIKDAAKLDLYSLQQFLAGRQRDLPQDTIQALDIALRESPNISATAFYKAQPIIEFAMEYLSLRDASRRLSDLDRIKVVNRNNYGNDCYAKEFGVKVANQLALVEARVLPAPRLKYHDSGKEKICNPSVGQWNMINKRTFLVYNIVECRMVNGGSISYWACLTFASSLHPNAIRMFCEDLVSMCNEIGMQMNVTPSVDIRQGRPDNLEASIRSIYKDSAECCAPKNVRKGGKQYLENLALKINVKVGGRNTVLEDALNKRIPLLTDLPTIVFGADVTHPPAGESSSPSIAAVVASMDWPQVTKYKCLVSAQGPREEIITNLYTEVRDSAKGIVRGGMVRELLISFYKSTGCKPSRIIFYRDGVSEGQFSQILLYEMDAIRRACASLEEGYLPNVTFVVVQKRHHTRLFPEDHRSREQTDRSGNILPVPPAYYAHLAAFRARYYMEDEASDQDSSLATSRACDQPVPGSIRLIDVFARRRRRGTSAEVAPLVRSSGAEVAPVVIAAGAARGGRGPGGGRFHAPQQAAGGRGGYYAVAQGRGRGSGGPVPTPAGVEALSGEMQSRMVISGAPVGPSSSSSVPAPAPAAPVRVVQSLQTGGTQAVAAPESRLPPTSSKALAFPARPGYGTVGRRCRVRANHFLVQLADKEIYHYDVTITPESKSRDRNRWIINELVKTHKQYLDGRLPVYDGRKGLFTAGPLPFQTKEFALKLTNPDRVNQGEKEYKVTIKDAAKLDMYSLKQFLAGRQRELPQDTIQALDIALRECPTSRYVSISRSFFSQAFGRGRDFDIGGGVECWRDISATAFYKAQPIINFALEYLNIRDTSRHLSDQDRMKLKKALKGVRVAVTHRRDISIRYKITGLTSNPLNDLTFLQVNRILAIYAGRVKRLCETELGVITQCCLPRNVQKGGQQYLQNLALKINVKVRDGVSEGQFSQVLLYEMDAICKACASLEVGYLPPVTFIVVQKRHHTRIFPEDHRARDQMDRSGNILPGTVVDTKICHPSEFDFYLCSHSGIQGTSRPTHYHVLFDENHFTADALQTLTYNLCYTYARCTRSVSIVPPAYYAHLAAFRARHYLDDGLSDQGSSASSSRLHDRSVPVTRLPNVKENVKQFMFYC